VIPVAATIAASFLVGVGGARRYPGRAKDWAHSVLRVILYGLLPFIAFFNIARLPITVDLAAALGLALVTAAVVGVLAWTSARRVLHVPRPTAGSVAVSATQGNTGYLGLPVSVALLGTGALGTAIAYDAVLSIATLFIGGAAIGAAVGERAGATGRERIRAFLLRNPPLLAVVLALLAPDGVAPQALVDISHVAAIALAPLGFFALGAILTGEAAEGQLSLPPKLTPPVGTAIVLKVVVTPLLLMVLAAPLLDLPRAFLLQAAMPCGVNGLVIAHVYGLDVRTSAAAIAWSTVIVLAGALVVALL
jgi:predicted permease